MSFKTILYEVKDNIAKITLNQPEKRNSLNRHTLKEIIEALENSRDDPEVRVIVITGAGDKVFCAGADINEFKGNSFLGKREQVELYAKLCLTFPYLKKPSIAAVNGLALAGGCGLAISPDITIASENAKFGVPEINVGLWSMMVSAILLRSVGRKKALEMMCIGELIDAFEAHRIGLINKVVPQNQLEKTVFELADKLKSKSPIVLKLGLESFYTMSDMELMKAITYLREMITVLLNTEDAQEGIQAFFEKRVPKWKGK